MQGVQDGASRAPVPVVMEGISETVPRWGVRDAPGRPQARRGGAGMPLGGGLAELVERWTEPAGGAETGARAADPLAAAPDGGQHHVGVDPPGAERPADSWSTSLTALLEPPPAVARLTADDLEDALEDLLRREAHRHGLDGGAR